MKFVLAFPFFTV